jgi:hypothetical protein
MSLTGGWLYNLRIQRGGGVKGSTSAAFTVSVDASVRTVLELKQAIVGQHPELKTGGPLQLQLKGQAGRGGRVTLPDTAQLATLDLEQRCVPGPGGARPEAALMVNQGPLPQTYTPHAEAGGSDGNDGAAQTEEDTRRVGGGLLTGPLLEHLASASAAHPPSAAAAAGGSSSGDPAATGEQLLHTEEGFADEFEAVELDFSGADFGFGGGGGSPSPEQERRPPTNSPTAQVGGGADR